MQRFAQFMIGIFKYHKLKLALVVSSAIVFTFLMFPYDDLADVVSTQISEATQGQVIFNFDSMGLALIPQPSLSLEKVTIETPILSNLKADEVKLSVSLPALLAFRTGLVLETSGFLKGQADLSVREGQRNKDGSRKFSIHLEAEGLDLNEIKKVADLPVPIKGSLNLNLETLLDTSFAAQPEGDVKLNTAVVEMPASSVATLYGPMNLPSIKWSSMVFKGRMSGGKFIVEEAKLGGPQDPLFAQVKGQMDVRLTKMGAQVFPDFGAYDLKVELTLNKSIEREFDSFLSLIDSYRSPTLTGSKYLFRASGTRMGTPPRFSTLPSFQ